MLSKCISKSYIQTLQQAIPYNPTTQLMLSKCICKTLHIKHCNRQKPKILLINKFSSRESEQN